MSRRLGTLSINVNLDFDIECTRQYHTQDCISMGWKGTSLAPRIIRPGKYSDEIGES